MSIDIALRVYCADEKYNFRPLPFQPGKRAGQHDSVQYRIERIRAAASALEASGLRLTMDEAQQQNQPAIIVLLAESKQLADPEFLDRLVSSPLRMGIEPSERQKPAHQTYLPILTVAPDDFLPAVIPASVAPESAYPTESIQTPQNLTFDPRIAFLDSSIWHRFVPEYSPHETDFQDRLQSDLREMCKAWQDGLYYSVAAISTLEFQVRMVRHSFIGKFGTKGHADLVTPFKFHSERLFQYKLTREEKFFTDKIWNGQSLLEALHWRVLVVDDYADNLINTVEEKQHCRVSKATLLWRPLHRLYEKIGLYKGEAAAHTFTNSHFKLVAKRGEQANKDIVNFALQQIGDTAFDLILLDYLLGDKIGANHIREYGDEFLWRIVEDNNGDEPPRYRRDIQGKFWIFPISSFPYALPDRLYQLGISHLHSIWHLSHGSDPLATPHAYTYYLLRFMKQKIRAYFLDPRALELLFNQIPERLNPNDLESRKRWAGHLRDALQRYESRLSLLKRYGFDESSDSIFLKSILDFVEDQTKLREVVQHLLIVCDDIVQLNGSVRENTLRALEEKAVSLPVQYTPVLKKFLDHTRAFAQPDLKTVQDVYIYVIYHEKDEDRADELLTYLAPYQRNYRINIRDKRKILAGTDLLMETSRWLNETHVFLCLVSAYLLADDSIDKTLQEAQRRHKNRTAIALKASIRIHPETNDSPLQDFERIANKPMTSPNDDEWLTKATKTFWDKMNANFNIQQRQAQTETVPGDHFEQ